MLHVTSANFEAEVKASEKPVVVKFFATWCGPCRAMTPVVEEIEREIGDRVKVVEVDIDESPDLATNYKIAVVPTFVLLKAGKEVARNSGMMGKEDLKALMLG